MNTIYAIHLDQWVEEGGAGVPGGFHQQSDRKPRSDTRDARSFLPTKRCANEVKRGKQEVQWLPSTPIEQGTWRPGAKEATLPAQVCSISARYQSHSEDR